MIPAFQRGLRPAWQGSDPPAGGGDPVINPNLLLWTEEFDDAVWVKTNATVTADAAAGPPEVGGTTADQVDLTPSTGAVRQTSTTLGSGSLSPKIITLTGTWTRQALSGTLGSPVVWSAWFLDNGSGADIRMTLDVSGGFVRVGFQDIGDGASFFVTGAKLEVGGLTTYIRRGGS